VAKFVINEWLWHDAAGDNGLEGQRRALRAITWLAGSDNQIVVIEEVRLTERRGRSAGVKMQSLAN